jgi:hypothetical protein
MTYGPGTRGLRSLAPATLMTLAFGAFAETPSITVDSVTLGSSNVGVTTNTYNGKPAVCTDNKADGLGVAASFTPSYTPDNQITNGTPGDCAAAKSGVTDCGAVPSGAIRNACATADSGNPAKGFKTRTDTKLHITNTGVTATAKDDFDDIADVHTGSGTLSQDLADTDGLIPVMVSATADEDHSTATRTSYLWYNHTKCNTSGSNKYLSTTNGDFGSYGPATRVHSSAATKTAQYYLDVEAPTMSHVILSTTVEQGNHQSHTTRVSGGSSQQNYDLSAEAKGPHLGDGTTLGPASLTDQTFDTDTSDGIAADAVDTDVMYLDTYCPATPIGTYSDSAFVAPTDLCGNTPWGISGVIDSSSNGDASLEFDVTACTPSGLTIQPDVFAPLDGINYTGVQCYTSMLSATGKGRNKNHVLAYPGTLHAAAVLSNDSGEDQTGVTITITIPEDFDFTLTGKSPSVHVYGGDITASFDAHDGAPLAGVPPARYDLTPVSAGTKTVTISNIDLGDDPGVLKDGKMIFARAHVNLTEASTDVNNADNMDKLEEFQASAYSTESGDIGRNSTDPYVIQNPTEGCEDGLLSPI